MSNVQTTRDLRAGDVIDGHRTMKVNTVTPRGLYLEDVESGRSFYEQHPDDAEVADTWRFDLVKRTGRKYKVGDLLDGGELNERQWKRGTIVRYRGPDARVNGNQYVLLADGTWTNIDLGTRVTFYAFGSGAQYSIEHIG